MGTEEERAGLERRGCAAAGAGTISRHTGLIDNEMKECRLCERACRWDMIDNSFFGFTAGCPEKKKL